MAFMRSKPSTKSANEASAADLKSITSADKLRELASENHIKTSPLDVIALAECLGIKLRFEPLPDNISGSLKKEKKTGKWVMQINALHHPTRQRFTIAHELGHHILHGGIKNEFSDEEFFRSNESDWMEVEANRFAADILMPENEFRNYIINTSKKVAEIASHFQVSPKAVTVRAEQLGYGRQPQ